MATHTTNFLAIPSPGAVTSRQKEGARSVPAPSLVKIKLLVFLQQFLHPHCHLAYASVVPVWVRNGGEVDFFEDDFMLCVEFVFTPCVFFHPLALQLQECYASEQFRWYFFDLLVREDEDLCKVLSVVFLLQAVDKRAFDDGYFAAICADVRIGPDESCLCPDGNRVSGIVVHVKVSISLLNPA